MFDFLKKLFSNNTHNVKQTQIAGNNSTQIQIGGSDNYQRQDFNNCHIETISKNGQVYIDYNGNHVVVPGNEVTIIEGMIFVDGERVNI